MAEKRYRPETYQEIIHRAERMTFEIRDAMGKDTLKHHDVLMD